MKTKTKFLLGTLIFILLVATITGIWIKDNSDSTLILTAEIEGFKLKVGENYTHIYTSGTETICDETGRCFLTIYSSTVFSNESGGWYPLPALANVTWESGGFNFSYGDYWFLLEPFVIHNGNTYTIDEIRELFPNINLRNYINPSRLDYKYALNFTNIPENLANNIDWIGLRIAGSNGLTWDDIEIDNYNVIIKDKVYFDFGDLIESGYTLNRINKSVLLIGNISEHWDNGSIYLDPTIVLNGGGENLEDTGLQEVNPTYNYGGSSTSIFNNRSTTNYYSYFKFNISSIPAGQQIDGVNFSLNIVSNTLDNNEAFDVVAYYVKEFPSFNVSGSPWLEGDESGGESTAPEISWNTRATTSVQMNLTPYFTGIRANNTPYPPTGVNFNFTLTGIIAEGYANGDENITFFIAGNNLSTNVPDAFDYIVHRMKEFGGTANDPILYIIYSEAPAEGDTCTYNGTGNWAVDCSDDCVINATQDIMGNNISISGTGTFFTNFSIINFTDLLIVGTDSSNRCVVTCEDNCFEGGT